MDRERLAFALVLVLLGTASAAVAVGTVLDRSPRQVAGVVQAYLAAVERRDLAAALEHLAPGQRAVHRDFVANLLGNRFQVRAISVRAPSLLDRWLAGRPGWPVSASIMVVVNPGTPQAWQATTVVRVSRQDGRWYLEAPPLKPPE